ncbi:MAG: aldolase catalytic domain-containing protein [Candidatus Schekmanbacteria bacterium]|nr:aldolase catalytic domain-containing protein [Candidatus Schekmanbacteria bacterium]
MAKENDSEKKGSWLTYRPDIKVMDCTIRDGGLMTNSRFDDEFVRAVYQTCVDAGIDYMELGYKGDKKIYSPQEYGSWKFCSEEDIRRIVEDNPTSLKLAAMADVDRTDYHNDILPKSQSILDMIRVAAYIHQIPAAMDMIKDAHDKGFETTINLMATSVVAESELDEALGLLCKTEVEVIYLVDSYGSLYSEEIQALTKKYLKYAEAAGKKIGIHTHNNQQLAYANTIESLILGASYLDSTMGGLGRGAGNCPTELLLGFLKNPKFHLRPVVQCLQDYIVPLKQKVEWGYDIPYMLTGQMNMHPRSAMAFLDKQRKDYVAFYDSLSDEE